MALFHRPALLAGAAAAALGWGLVAVPVLLLWGATPTADSDLSAVPRLAAGIWLLAHGGPLRWEGPAGAATLGVAPLLVTALVAVLVHLAAARTGRIGEVLLGYLAVAVFAALIALPGMPRSEPVPDLFRVVLLALPAAMAGARRSTGEWGLVAGWQALRGRGEWLGVWPVCAPEGRVARWAGHARGLGDHRDRALRAGLAGALTLLGGGALVLLGALVAHPGAAGALAAQLAPDLAGRLALLLLCVVLLPNAAVWAASYALGPGFALGGSVAAGGTDALPPLAFPLIADAPSPGRSALGLLALLAPALAGPVVACFLAQGADPAAADDDEDAEPAPEPESATSAALTALAASACTGLLAGAAALWSGGALGDAALAHVGPQAAWTALAAFGWTAALALPTLFLLRHRAARRPADSPTRTGRLAVLAEPELAQES